ncbi:MAG: Recombinase [Pelotomaculum sp. PtaB.Bin013]|uniref:Recombinase family protein n=1 Tax=Pelotomaculum isophthalicicum JI TaxID=947010 RepID=A0A9X4JWQ5_9FIRM|nr:recombinase family protein [Pelotomaculum isophthalicicum]MDF9409673.1 recombinase family protein [Pelotomaculum isophthalicicum JI]OPX90489.1 MAG: Recombinase [Pelotomaculum sp. PtaB.Bin013]
MQKHRYIPFGYKICNGETVPHEQEAEAVRMIFQKYLRESLSCQALADLLTAQGVPYREKSFVWNKSMVKRILDTPKYMGADGYPQLVSEAEFQQAHAIKAVKYTRRAVPPSPLAAAMKNRLSCHECGSGYGRRLDNRYGGKWHCKNQDCKTEIRITDAWLQDGLTAMMNRVIADPAELEMEKTPSNVHTLEVTKLNNEINRELDKKDLNEDYVKALIMGCAAEKYANCAEGDTQYLTEILAREFDRQDPLTEFDIELFTRTVEKASIAKDGTIHVRFINQKTMSRLNNEGKE